MANAIRACRATTSKLVSADDFLSVGLREGRHSSSPGTWLVKRRTDDKLPYINIILFIRSQTIVHCYVGPDLIGEPEFSQTAFNELQVNDLLHAN